MRKFRTIPMVVIAAALVASALACNLPTRTTPPPPPDTVTPYVPATLPPQDATSPPAESTQPAEPTDASPPAATEPAPPTVPPTDPPPPPTPVPTIPVSEGPLDFEEPRWVHAWMPTDDGGVVLTITIKIVGGAPPFTIKHEDGYVGTTMQRQYYFGFHWSGCGGIARNITVESADGQSITHDYWLSRDVMGWCD